MRKITAITSFGILCLAAFGAHAQSKIQATPAQKQASYDALRKMTPEQRKMMQDMMGKQGVGMGAGGPGAMSIKICMTQEMIERNELPAQQGDCKNTVSPRTGNTMKFAFRCTKPVSNGEGEVTFISPQAYTSKMTMSNTTAGKTERMTMDSQGKWLSTECGAIRPIDTNKS